MKKCFNLVDKLSRKVYNKDVKRNKRGKKIMFTLKQVKANGGLTIDTMGRVVEYRKGYQVSKEDLAVVPVYKVRKFMLLEILNMLRDDEFLGLWIYEGKMYIDCSEHINTKREALKLGKAREQKTIWNWKASEAIAC